MTEERRVLEAEPPCIWAQAGVLSYRLCDRHYECEDCPLFQALSGEREPAVAAALAPNGVPAPPVPEGPWAAVVSAYLARLLAGCSLRLDRAYDAGHWWLDSTRFPDLTLGLEEHVLRVLSPIDDIVIPRPGTTLRRSAPCTWILRGRTAVPLPAPVAGSVEEVNRRYAEALRVWGRLPEGDDWLMRVAAHEDLDTVPGVYRGEAALAWHLKNLRLLRHTLREAVARGAREVGPTLADGGEPNLDLERVLGRARFAALVAEMFPMPPS